LLYLFLEVLLQDVIMMTIGRLTVLDVVAVPLTLGQAEEAQDSIIL
jgi:hypothetical protein